MTIGASQPAVCHREPTWCWRKRWCRGRRACNGYTLLAVGSNNMINVTLYEKLNFDFIRDIAPVASIGRVPQVMEVNPSFPAKTVPEFIAYARANPDKLSFASAGIGSTAHLDGELFQAAPMQ